MTTVYKCTHELPGVRPIKHHGRQNFEGLAKLRPVLVRAPR